ncbi:DUF4064 domain-containing protein [Amphibacillus sediminis]|uniref:DUF4064 domain-containing protein n=1 Tax=Amphibacillus sediminis TaxID=360185 RepID=UPI00083431EF|nr:DUF4064 domain-containing protein [Amphibacillus sediminis]
MIKRKIEIILITLGAIIFAFFCVLGISMMAVKNDESAVSNLYNEMKLEFAVEEMPEYAEFLETISRGAILMIAIAVIAIVAGVLSAIMLKGNKRPKPAGIVLLALGLIIGFLQFGISLFGGMLYAIAGAMALFRKPKPQEIVS